jgi:coniferyl-aldehyde dehydrogenase
VPAAKHDAFIAAYTAEAARLYRRIVKNRDYTSIVSERHYARLLALADDARAKGAAIKVIDPANELEGGAIGASASRKIAPVLLMSVNDGMSIMQEEIFGPLLPVEPYASLEEAIAKVNDRPRPLALYYFDRDARRVGEVLERTVSGGASVNDTIFHVAQEGLPFGGIGPSGMGSYHGHDGFKTFSHARGVFHQAALAPTDLLSPPYGARFDTIIATLIRRFKGWR